MADSTITASYISGLFTVAAAMIVFGPVAFQLWKQGKLNRDALIEAEKTRFKSELYSEGVRAARRLSNAASQFNGYLRAAQFQVEIAHLANEEGHPPQVPSNRFPDVIQLQRECSDSLLELLFLIEERRIIDPNRSYSQTVA